MTKDRNDGRADRSLPLPDDFLHYETDTAPGSSGSPVFNDQREVVGLHHSGVPRRDEQGRILARSGELWTQAMGESAIGWIANEGVRVSRICRHLRALPLSGRQAELRDGLLAALPRPYVVPAVAPAASTSAWAGSSRSSRARTQARIVVPLEITVSLGSVPTLPQPGRPSLPHPRPPGTGGRAGSAGRGAGGRRTTTRRGDSAASAEYYSALDRCAGGGEELLRTLSALVTAPTSPCPATSRRSSCTPTSTSSPTASCAASTPGRMFAPEVIITEDLRTDQRRAQTLELRLAESSVASVAALEADSKPLCPSTRTRRAPVVVRQGGADEG